MTTRIEMHNGIMVVRDDLTGVGGSKTHVFKALMQDTSAKVFVYASPAYGSAQLALADAAKKAGKQAVIFVAQRKSLHAKTLLAAKLGAMIVEVKPGYLNVVQARAREYALQYGYYLVPFGGYTEHATILTDVAKSLGCNPKQVWTAGGSGTLAKHIHKAWPKAELNIVQVGKTIDNDLAVIHKANLPFNKPHKRNESFTSDLYYESKAWQVCINNCGQDALFWNVAAEVS